MSEQRKQNTKKIFEVKINRLEFEVWLGAGVVMLS